MHSKILLGIGDFFSSCCGAISCCDGVTSSFSSAEPVEISPSSTSSTSTSKSVGASPYRWNRWEKRRGRLAETDGGGSPAKKSRFFVYNIPLSANPTK